MRARRVRFVAPRQVRVEPVDVDEPKPGAILVRTEYSGISGGTEMLAYRGEIDPSVPLDETLGALGGTFAFPFSYGYGSVGIVEETQGRAARGDRVFAFHPHQDVFVVNEADAVALEAADPRTATLLPLVETALQVALDAGPRLDETVVVTGLGPIGILTGALLQRSGADVIGSDPDSLRRDAAAGFGLRTVQPEDLPTAVSVSTRDRGVPLAVEASGNPQALADALDLLAHEGTALVCSWYGTKPVPLPLGAAFHRRRLTIRSTQVSTVPAALQATWDRERRRKVARRLLNELPVKLLATHEFPFHDAALAFEAVDRGRPGLLHAALRYR